MKKQLTLIAIIALIGNLMYAQSDDAFKLEKSKMLSKIDKLALAQIVVNYKLSTTEKTIGKDKSSGAIAGAKISAYLQTSDGDLTDSDFQEVTDYFYSYFQKKLKEGGIDTVAWSIITAADFYKNAASEKDDKKEEKGENASVTYVAHKGNVLHSGQLAFAFGKIKKGGRFAEDIGAPAAYIEVTLDFADVMVNVDIKTAGSGLYYPKSQTTKFQSAVKAEMSVINPDNGSTMFWNQKTQGEFLFLKNKGVTAGASYSDNVTEDVSKARSGLAKQFAFRKEMTPVVIETTRAKYKAAAKKTLEKYADAFVVKMKALKKD